MISFVMFNMFVRRYLIFFMSQPLYFSYVKIDETTIVTNISAISRRMDISSLIPAGLQSGHTNLPDIPLPGYNKLSENLRKFTPQAIQCAIFCGGSRCKYENPKAWPPVHMAIQNVFSHW